MSDELQLKVDRAIKIMQAAGRVAQKHGQPLEICYSGGKDSEVILELARMSGVNIRPIYKNTTIDPPGTITHARSKNVEIMQPSETFAQIMARKGWPSRKARFCCSLLKEYKVLDYAVVGIRRDESKKRAERYLEPEICRVYNAKEEAQQILPIIDWTAADVKSFIEERNIKCHPLYYDENGTFHVERRLGCIGCPLASRRKRIAEFKAYPNMVKMYCRQGEIYRKSHPNSPTNKKLPTVFDWFVFTLYCNNINDFNYKFRATPIFGNDAIDTKAFLEKEFDIKL